MSPRPRDRILENLDRIYREAYKRAKETDDASRMLDLDASYQREQLILEVLLDVRDALDRIAGGSAESMLDKLKALKKVTKLAK